MIDNGVVVALTPEELKSLLLVARDENFQFYVLVLITVCHGLRVSEAIALRRSNFSVSAGGTFLAVKRLKGSKATNQRLIASPNALLNEQAVVAEYIADLGPSDLLFRDEHGEKFTRFHINYLMRHLGKLADIPEHKHFPHCLKHTAGILMRQSGAKLEEIQEALGHKNINNTRVYLRTTQEEVDAARSNAFAAAVGEHK
jgi:integrase